MIKKWNQKNTKECDKRRSHISSKLYMYSNNGRHPVSKTFTTLHPTTLHFTTLVDTSLPSHLNVIKLHFTILSFGLTPFRDVIRLTDSAFDNHP